MTPRKNLSINSTKTKVIDKTLTRRKYETKTREKYKYKIAIFGTSPHGQSVHWLQNYFLVG